MTSPLAWLHHRHSHNMAGCTGSSDAACRLERTHVVDVLAGRGAGGGHDGGAVRHVIMMSWRLHLHVAALGVFGHSGGVVDGGVWVFTVEGAGAGQGALGVIYKHTQQVDLLPW